ncbi:hypothetical protein N836_00270 [Leptolyngbya sp. Heron Island J]|uniref:hypothetical protein n=1 Tax=Leptolyngbya sp. Heron Island J TaxID=1385935 RepID=UPI0003B9CAF6|nr:hypothetical protein [Leptolyngbya sp. Heron Island J]ESA37147.1 hypothetical protein N836_00270 [Leptolyngbya sp. Heron Island J]
MWNLLKSGGALLVLFMGMTLFFASIEKGHLKLGPIIDDGMVMAARVYRSVTQPLPNQNAEER